MPPPPPNPAQVERVDPNALARDLRPPPTSIMGHSSVVVIHHTGPVTQDAVVAHGRVLRALPGLNENARYRVFAAFVELAQNIARYSAERAGPPGEERGSGTLTVSASADAIVLTAANLLSEPAADALAAQLRALAPLTPAELKKLHRERRRAAPPPGSLGAGLGLIDLARRAAPPLSHHIEPVPGGLVRFTLIVPLPAA